MATIFLVTLFAFFISVGDAVCGQQAAKIPRVGFFSLSGTTFSIDAFRQGLRELGYVEGKDIILEYRTPEARSERRLDLINELIQRNVDVIVTSAQPAIERAKQMTKTIPIVMVGAVDPVTSGIVDSLARPGGNITGISTLARELSGKRLELFKEALPRLSRVGLLWNPTGPGPRLAVKHYEALAPALKLALHSLEARGPNPDFEGLFQSANKAGANALIVVRNSLLDRFTKQIAELSIKHRQPSMCERSEYVDDGGLMSYSANDAANWRRAAYYVDRILKGTKPAELPVEQPMRFELVVNLKTAKEIGVTIAPNFLARADRVIR